MTIKDLAAAKWRASGLSDEQAEKLGFKALPAVEVKQLSPAFHAAGALYIPYWGFEGEQTSFFRLRYLENLPGFAGLAAKPQRYVQLPKSLNEVYLPPLLQTSWDVIAEDPKIPVYITEGELKAACAAVYGFACIGLGGVDMWRSSKRGLELLPQLARFDWCQRPVVIVFDSDAATNVNVVRAQRQLSGELTEKGALVAIVSLPSAKDGKKQGLDDFLIAEGPEAFFTLLKDTLYIPEAVALWGLNEEVVYVRDPGILIVRDSGQKISPSDFVSHTYANRHYATQQLSKQGTEKMIKKPLAPRWMKWEHRFEMECLTYAPGKPQFYEDRFNTWQGWGVSPLEGDVTWWHDLMDYFFKKEVDNRVWFERQLAYPLQFPGTKLYTASLLWSQTKGVGKTLVAYFMMRIYGAKNCSEVKSKDLRGSFNSWAASKQFIYGDEITGNDARIDSDWLKGLITQETIRINTKFVPEYVLPDTANWMFSSNHPDALFIEDGDRRYFIHEIVGNPASREFYEKLDRQLKGDGPAKLFNYLLNLDLGDFNPRAHAPTSEAKSAMVIDAKSDVGMWVVQLREDPTVALRTLGDKPSRECELFSAQQLLRAYDPDGSRRVTAGGLGRELKRAGFRQLNGGPIRTGLGVHRLYVVRNEREWAERGHNGAAEHVDKFFQAPPERKF